jgi:hypothetical protein
MPGEVAATGRATTRGIDSTKSRRTNGDEKDRNLAN